MLALNLKQQFFKKKIDPDPDPSPAFYWHPKKKRRLEQDIRTLDLCYIGAVFLHLSKGSLLSLRFILLRFLFCGSLSKQKIHPRESWTEDENENDGGRGEVVFSLLLAPPPSFLHWPRPRVSLEHTEKHPKKPPAMWGRARASCSELSIQQGAGGSL